MQSKKKLVVIDVQNDFVTGSLGTKEAQAMLPRLIEKVKAFDGEILMTRDTHEADYGDAGGPDASGATLYPRHGGLGAGTGAGGDPCGAESQGI